jgi:hypothetical protein
MRKVFSIFMLLCLTGSMVFCAMAQETVTVTGVLVDNKCAQANAADLGNFVTTHTKECALLPECQASGYSIYAEGVLTKLSEDSWAKVVEFLNSENSKLDVVLTAEKSGQELKVISIENQK